MSPKQAKHYDVNFKHVVQPLQSDARRIYDYEGEDSVPAPLKSPLTPDEVAPYLDQDLLVTFTVRVPLEVVTVCGELLYEHVIAMAFVEPVSLDSFEFRAVGASFGRFDAQLSGDVHLQVTAGVSTKTQ